ncbi:alpha/beta hydrolase family protein [Hirsutella rhossiliensis]|uniref:Alpha/beta hydrolase family domain-containing protein n=1 Tax=Hirsutella rhossiliensis TaxID=111463 RepID=A0A9P8MZ48_9HYPO|nr:alpha/beta hydrolase family domain-containing protein [Hirsutella rhossiliensis]KAH0963977.1 alpha/beta hydrolase family domain-containing protein [Hirsutella rhossiliensis]
MAPNCSFVFVPGAWHRPETWDKLIAEIEPKGYKCVAVTLPSTLSDPAITFEDDVKAVQNAIVKETTLGRDVVLVVHSYGGHVGNSAIKGFAAKDSRPGRVIGLAMMATGFTVSGRCFMDGLGGKPPPEWKDDVENGFVVIVVDPREMFYHDLPEKEGTAWVSKLTKHSLKSLYEGAPYSYAGWQDVPCWFLLTTQDKALPAQAQHMFVKAAQDAGADVTVREIESSHSPMLSRPKETADFVLEAAADFERKRRN